MPPFLIPLDAPTLRDLGVPEPWDYGLADQVRFYEIDSLGHVNNVAYLRWFETIRVRWIKDKGLYDAGLQSVLRAQGCDYHAPMFLDDAYIVTTRCASMRTTSFRCDYAVWTGGSLRATGFAAVVATDASGARKTAIPGAIRDRLLAAGGEEGPSEQV